MLIGSKNRLTGPVWCCYNSNSNGNSNSVYHSLQARCQFLSFSFAYELSPEPRLVVRKFCLLQGKREENTLHNQQQQGLAI